MRDDKPPASATPYGWAMLAAMQRPDRWAAIYGGTVPAGVVQQRRDRNKRARAARRRNRT